MRERHRRDIVLKTDPVTREKYWSNEVVTIYKPDEGALDPAGMKFDGIGCLKKEGEDTVFFISCHIDRSKLYRIINHSKFELVLDTLIISPEHTEESGGRGNTASQSVSTSRAA